jgi:hypothetical protein
VRTRASSSVFDAAKALLRLLQLIRVVKTTVVKRSNDIGMVESLGVKTGALYHRGGPGSIDVSIK